LQQALQKLYNISDEQTEYQIKDRLSFRRFLGLSLSDTAPDAKTIWNFRNELVKTGSIDTIFYRFVRRLEERDIITRSGSIIDATCVAVSKQRNSREENKMIKEGQIPKEWEKKQNRHKKRKRTPMPGGR
jgi:IS5 family transposase